MLIADANTFLRIDQFMSIPGFRSGLWKVEHSPKHHSMEALHWEFHWFAPGALDLAHLPTPASSPDPDLPLGDWEEIENELVFSSGKISMFDKDMMLKYINHTGDERLVIDVCQDPFSDTMSYQGVLPGGFFGGSNILLEFLARFTDFTRNLIATAHDGKYRIHARRHEGQIVQLKVRQVTA